MLVRALERGFDARACRRVSAPEEVEVPAEQVADPGGAGADAEEDEAAGEDDDESDVDPLRVAAQPGEGELVFPRRRLARGRLLSRLWLGGFPPRLCSSSGH